MKNPYFGGHFENNMEVFKNFEKKILRLKSSASSDTMCKKSRRNSKIFFFWVGHFEIFLKIKKIFKKRSAPDSISRNFGTMCKNSRENPASFRRSSDTNTHTHTQTHTHTDTHTRLRKHLPFYSLWTLYSLKAVWE